MLARPYAIAVGSPPIDRHDPLRRQVRGAVVSPDAPDYDRAHEPWNRAMQHRPCVVVIAADAEDVRVAVRYAADHGLGIGIQSTGHGPVVPVDGLLVVTTHLDDVSIDPVARTVRAGAGATWGPVLAAAQRHGLAPLAGSSPTVGVVGYSLAGGLGWLARRFGPACDTVRSIEIVTPAGRIVRASTVEEPELFRVLRGGGGGAIGVVTAIELELFEVDRVHAGNLVYPADAAAEVMDAYCTWVADAPEELTTSVVHINHPPVAAVPEPLRGRACTHVRGCWAGDLGDGRRFVDRLRAALPPLIDLWRDDRFAHQARISNDRIDPVPLRTTGGWLTHLDGAVGAVLAGATFPTDGPPLLRFTEVRHLGGAVRTSDHRPMSVMGHRDSTFLLNAVSIPIEPGREALVDAGIAALRDGLGPALSDDVYLNFLDGPARRARAADGLDPADRERVAAVHRRFDPDHRLRYGVGPAG